jgi:hypothetical protein
MEYLMTYGWAILIIAVVLGALFSLGVFNGLSLAPKAPPGACQVYKPGGTGTTFVELTGECNNYEPQYVAQFNGASSYINTGTTGLPLGNSPFSIFAWVYTTNAAPYGTIYTYGTWSSGNVMSFYVNGGRLVVQDIAASTSSCGPTITTNMWHFVGYTYSPSSNTFYIDGSANTINCGLSPGFNTVSGPASIGATSIISTYYFTGSMADVQVYSTVLSASDVNSLYAEGIGGAPILSDGLVGWWPLNGNANDYSSNNNNGQAFSVTYTTTWTQGYTPP